ncbi:unnamed protein product [marine sediment metagenome]|uniref:Uncharacterized protein n=1 Tax=marine sediment metagenome TaxID=412755 RepID=X1T1X8_9ZZZZ
MAKVTITVLGRKVKEYETKGNKMPDVIGFLKEMKKLGVKTKASVSITPKLD